MATKSVLKSSASALFALALGTAALLPGTATAQERDMRGPRGGAERVERASPAQAPAWQSRGGGANPQSGWNNRPSVASQGNWNRDRERGDRGNGVNPIGQPTFGQSGRNQSGGAQANGGRPAWAYNGGQGSTPRPGNGSYQGSQFPQGGTTAPAWGGRNPTYVDPSRGNPGRGNDGRANEGRGRDNDWRGNDGRGNWNRDRDRDRDSDWRRNNNGQWNRGGWGANASRDWDRDRDRDRDHWRGNNWNNRGWGYNNGWNNRGWGYNNGWNNNRWGYNNGWRGWDRDGWRRNNRYDWYRWRDRHRSTFSLGFYYAPWQGYSYSRFNIGVVIGEPFYAERYWLADPWAYRLPPADGPYRWVRYYNDALLVDIYSGEVVDAVYDIFW